MKTRIGVLTAGGHISSFHAGMKGICRAAEGRYDVLGFRNGYAGAMNGVPVTLNHDSINENEPGSFLGTSRKKAEPEAIERNMKRLEINALIAMGGNDTLGDAALLSEYGIKVVGWPKTMDNDLSGTYFCLGYPTAVDAAAKFVMGAQYDAMTNSRVVIVTMFGRDTDWVAAGAGIWGAADVVVPGEKASYTLDFIHDRIAERYERNGETYGSKFAVAVVAEGARIEGLKSHLREDMTDEHENTKIEPMELAIILRDALHGFGPEKLPVASDCISYFMRNSPSSNIDKKMAELAGKKCVEMIDAGLFGHSAVVTEELGMDAAQLETVSKQRFLSQEGFIDYDKMAVNTSFINYYSRIFGEPARKEDFAWRA